MVTLQALPARQLGKLHDWLKIIAALRRLRLPIQSADDLRAVLALVSIIAENLGVDQAWLERVEKISETPATFDVVLALARWASAALFVAQDDEPQALSSYATSEIHPQALADWLPIVLQIMDLLRRMREE